MKTLIGFRHSLKDKDNNISPEGLARAERQGKACEKYKISRMWVGPLIRTTQTRNAFLNGYIVGWLGKNLEVRIIDNPVVALGTDELFGLMVNDVFKAAVAAKKSNFDALLAAHGQDQLEKWADTLFDAMDDMFTELGDGETGAFFGHSPTTELVAASVEQSLEDLAAEYRVLPEMAAIIFEQDNRGNFKAVGCIPVPPTPEQASE